MATYKVSISKTAEKTLQSVPQKIGERLIGAIASLAENVYPTGCRKLNSEESCYRIRVGHYRIIYEIKKSQLYILVVKIGHRKDIYR